MATDADPWRRIRGRSAVDRFFAKVEEHPSGCWIWTASLSPTGYGQFMFDGRPRGICKRGHDMSTAYVIQGVQVCRPCRLESNRQWRARQKEMVA